mmetsp:Transcript_96834/g.202321  ORF Transcript_96834/g.202321 Transcript_96834/m.202321 type:complete len:522 (+) Transcript_96834:229-1794(+)
MAECQGSIVGYVLVTCAYLVILLLMPTMSLPSGFEMTLRNTWKLTSELTRSVRFSQPQAQSGSSSIATAQAESTAASDRSFAESSYFPVFPGSKSLPISAPMTDDEVEDESADEEKVDNEIDQKVLHATLPTHLESSDGDDDREHRSAHGTHRTKGPTLHEKLLNQIRERNRQERADAKEPEPERQYAKDKSLAFTHHSHRQLGEKRFICDAEGKALPILISGVQKAGSTTIFDDLISTLWLRTDVQCIRGKSFYWPCKELHFFCKHKYGKRRFNSFWGSCARPRRGLIGEFTPENYHFPHIPREMLHEYGAASKELVFLVGLREPLARMLAAFTDGLSVGWIYHHERNLSFQEHVDEFLEMWDQQGGEKWIPEMYQTNSYRTVDQGLYYYKLRNWIDAGVSLSQFIVYPGSIYLNHRHDLNKNPVLEAVRARLGKDLLRPIKRINDTKVSNKGHHKSLDEELPKHYTKKRMLREVFAPANRRLMELLADGSKNGMTLVGYEGEAGDVAAVTDWMESQWKF